MHVHIGSHLCQSSDVHTYQGLAHNKELNRGLFFNYIDKERL